MSATRPRDAGRGWFWLGVLTAVLLLAAGLVIAVLGYRAGSGPADTVRGYFAALSRGDAPAALAFGDIPDGPRSLLTSDVLAEQQRIAPIRDVAVGATNERGGQAAVTVSYRLAFPDGPQQVTDNVPLTRRGGRWWLAAVAVRTQLRLLQAGDRASILGAPLPDGDTLLFPGALPITFDTPYLQLAPSLAAVGLAGGSSLDLQVQVSPAGRDAIVTAARTQLRRCLQRGAPPRCPLPSDRIVPGSLRGSVGGDLAAMLTLSVAVSAGGAVTISGDVPFTGTWSGLTFENLPQPRKGQLSLPIAATTPASPPVRITWEQTS